MSDFDIIVYSGGKTASTSLQECFQRNGYKTIHVHSNEEYKLVHKNLIPIYPNLTVFINSQIKEKVFIIDCYRNPIERHISSFFENITKTIDYNLVDNNILMYYFNKFLLGRIENYHPLDNETPILSDVNFNFNKKYSIKIVGNKTYIKLRFNDIELWPSIFNELIGKRITLLPVNNGDLLHPGYTLFKKCYKLPRSYLNKLNNDPIFNKYNTPEEIEKYKRYWESRSEDDIILRDSINYTFTRLPENFSAKKYIENNPKLLANYPTEIEAKMYYELFGYKLGLLF